MIFVTVLKGWFSLRIILLRTGTDREAPLSCELSVGTNGSNTKDTFLSVPVLRNVFLSGNQP